MKMLYILNVANRVNNFCMSSLIAAKKMNIEYHIAGNWSYANDSERMADEEKYGIHIHQIDFIRSPLDIRNYKAYKQLKEIVSREKYDVIHANTPTGGFLGRLIGKKYKVKKIIYQAHGFHFYKGAPKFNWLVYYPIEKWLAHYTDVLITINKEDYEISKKFKLRDNGKKYHVHGVGVDLNKFKKNNNDHSYIRHELGIQPNEKMLIYVAELNKNKNQMSLLNMLFELKKVRNDIKLVFVGRGNLESKLRAKSKKLGISEYVIFTGYRNDVSLLLAASDIAVPASIREGLGINVIEAMASGTLVVAYDNRGHRSIIENGKNGYLIPNSNHIKMANMVNHVLTDRETANSIVQKAYSTIEQYSFENSIMEMTTIYEIELNSHKYNNFGG